MEINNASKRSDLDRIKRNGVFFFFFLIEEAKGSAVPPFGNRRERRGSKDSSEGQNSPGVSILPCSSSDCRLSLWPANSENQLPTFETRPLLNSILRAGGLTTGCSATLSYYNRFPFLHLESQVSLFATRNSNSPTRTIETV